MRRGLAVLAVAGAATGWAVGAAEATAVNSDHKTVTVGSHNYTIWSYLENFAPSSGGYADAEIIRSDGNKASAGVLGAKSRFYAASGDLCQASSWVYNPSASIGETSDTYIDCGGTGYSQGNTAVFNVNDYVKHLPYRTTNLTIYQ